MVTTRSVKASQVLLYLTMSGEKPKGSLPGYGYGFLRCSLLQNVMYIVPPNSCAALHKLAMLAVDGRAGGMHYICICMEPLQT